MKEWKAKLLYRKKKLAFRLKNWADNMDDWYERNPVLGWVVDIIGDLAWFMIKAWICIQIFLWIIL